MGNRDDIAAAFQASTAIWEADRQHNGSPWLDISLVNRSGPTSREAPAYRERFGPYGDYEQAAEAVRKLFAWKALQEAADGSDEQRDAVMELSEIVFGEHAPSTLFPDAIHTLVRDDLSALKRAFANMKKAVETLNNMGIL